MAQKKRTYSINTGGTSLPTYKGSGVTGSDVLDASLDSIKYNYDSSLDPRANPSVRNAISNLSNDVDLEANRQAVNGSGTYESNLEKLRNQTGLTDYATLFQRLRDNGTLGLTNLKGDSLDTLGTGLNGRNAAYSGSSSSSSGSSSGGNQLEGLSGQQGYQSALNRLMSSSSSSGGGSGLGSFTYNQDTDPEYQAYKNQYERSANQSMNNTLGSVASRTGGLASSYATQAAQASYNDTMQGLNDKVPELYENAYNRWLTEYQLKKQEEEDAYNRQLQEEETAYQRAQDAKSEQEDNRSMLLSLMSNYGYQPTDEEFASAGLTSAQGQAILNTLFGTEDTSTGYSGGYSSSNTGSNANRNDNSNDNDDANGNDTADTVYVEGYGQVPWETAEKMERNGTVKIIGSDENGDPIYKIVQKLKVRAQNV